MSPGSKREARPPQALDKIARVEPPEAMSVSDGL